MGEGIPIGSKAERNLPKTLINCLTLSGKKRGLLGLKKYAGKSRIPVDQEA